MVVYIAFDRLADALTNMPFSWTNFYYSTPFGKRLQYSVIGIYKLIPFRNPTSNDAVPLFPFEKFSNLLIKPFSNFSVWLVLSTTQKYSKMINLLLLLIKNKALTRGKHIFSFSFYEKYSSLPDSQNFQIVYCPWTFQW